MATAIQSDTSKMKTYDEVKKAWSLDDNYLTSDAAIQWLMENMGWDSSRAWAEIRTWSQEKMTGETPERETPEVETPELPEGLDFNDWFYAKYGHYDIPGDTEGAKVRKDYLEYRGLSKDTLLGPDMLGGKGGDEKEKDEGGDEKVKGKGGEGGDEEKEKGGDTFSYKDGSASTAKDKDTTAKTPITASSSLGYLDDEYLRQIGQDASDAFREYRRSIYDPKNEAGTLQRLREKTSGADLYGYQPTYGRYLLNLTTPWGLPDDETMGDTLASIPEYMNTPQGFRNYLSGTEFRPQQDVRRSYADLTDYLYGFREGSGGLPGDIRFQTVFNPERTDLKQNILSSSLAALGPRGGLTGSKRMWDTLSNVYDTMLDRYGDRGAHAFSKWVTSAWDPSSSYLPMSEMEQKFADNPSLANTLAQQESMSMPQDQWKDYKDDSWEW